MAAMSPAYPTDPEDRERWEKARLMLRMLGDKHTLDLKKNQAQYLDPARLDAWGPPTLALNPFRSVIIQLAVLYDQDPIVQNVEPLSPEQATWMAALQPFRIARRHQAYVLALRESLYRISWSPPTAASPAGIDIREVTPDHVVVTASPVAPTVPLRIEEAVCRTPLNGKKESRAVWDCWDISDPTRPTFSIEEDIGGERKDVTRVFVEPVPYPYVDPSSGLPYLPYVVYHAEAHGCIWDPWGWGALVAGALDMSLLASFWIHVVKSASWQQKYGMDTELAGLSTADVPSGAAAGAAGKGVSRQRVTTDPASILMFNSKGDKQGSVNTLQASADPKAIIDAIMDYSRMIAESSGLSASDVELSAGSSGVAIQIRRDAVRRLQKAYEPHFRMGDEELLSKVALISNLFGEGAPVLPTTGWQVSYPGLPYSREEDAERLAGWDARIKLGLASRVDALMALSGLTREEASVALNRIASENRVFTGA